MKLNRCEHCGQLMGKQEHKCASVDLKGSRFCVDCSKKLNNFGYERWVRRCGSCEKMRWRNKERLLRQQLKESFGGKCSFCGYNKCFAALHFHHIHGRTGQYIKSGSVKVQEIRDFPERFQLICSNCHIEIHRKLK